MPKFESVPKPKGHALNPSETGADVKVVPKPEAKRTSEKTETLQEEGGQEQEAGQFPLSFEERLHKLERDIAARQQEIERLTGLVEGTKAELNQAREKLGLPPTEEDSPSVFSEKDKLAELRAEREALEKQREELVSQQEKERLIREAKEKILQEKLDELFGEFEALSSLDFESIFQSGKTLTGRSFESKSMGLLDAEVAQSLAKAFREGIKLLPKILEVLPELLKQFDEGLTWEAAERVDKKLEEEKARVEAGQEEKSKEPKSEDIQEVLEGEVPPGESSQFRPDIFQ